MEPDEVVLDESPAADAFPSPSSASDQTKWLQRQGITVGVDWASSEMRVEKEGGRTVVTITAREGEYVIAGLEEKS